MIHNPTPGPAIFIKRKRPMTESKVESDPKLLLIGIAPGAA